MVLMLLIMALTFWGKNESVTASLLLDFDEKLYCTYQVAAAISNLLAHFSLLSFLEAL